MPTAIDSAYVSIYPVTEGFGKAINTAMNKAGASGGQAFGDSLEPKVNSRMIAIGNIMSSLFIKAAAVVGQSWDAAISRADTMHSFPKVMASLGYSADEAAKSVETMSERLQGLPTSLDSMTGVVQMLAPVTGSLESATEVGLAFNDAVLASGKSTYEQSRALAQYSQMLSKGAVDLQSWRVLQEVMPGQLDQIAKAMLGSTATANDLYEAMKSGKKSFEDFNDALLKLDQEGYAGFDSFAEQAKNATGGIRTSMENMGTAVVRGLSNILDALGYDEIVAFLGGVRNAIKDFFDSIVPIFEFIGNGIKVVKAWFEENTVAEKLEQITPLIYGLATALALLPFGWVKAAIAGIVVAISTLWKKSEKFREIATKVWEKIRAVLAKVYDFAVKVFNFFAHTLPDAVRNFFERLDKWARELPDRIVAKVTALVNWIKAIPGRIWSWVKELGQKIIDFVTSIPQRIFDGIGNLGRKLFEKGKQLIQGFWDGVKQAWNDFLEWVGSHLNINGVAVFSGGGGLTVEVSGYDPTKHARGGIVTRATHLIAGEGGPEAIIPLSNPHLKPFLENSGDVYNIYIDDARINDDEAMRRATYDYLMVMQRYAKMQGA